MRVLLVDPHSIGRRDRGAETVGGALPSLGLLSLASVLRKEHDVAVLDCQFHTHGSAKKEMRRFNPDLVAITATTRGIGPALGLAQAAKSSGSLVVLGGSHPTLHPQECLESGTADAVVLGEAEETIVEFCAAVEQEQHLSGVRGIAFPQGGACVNTGPRPAIADLDVLPMHAWDLVPTERYMAPSASRKSKKSIALVTSRGCPWNCTFCSQARTGCTFRARSPPLIIEEMRHLRERYGKRDIRFSDDVFTFPRQRIERFCRLLKEESLDIGWCCNTRADLLDRDLLRLMKDAGCYQVSFGAESGNDRMLQRISKQLTASAITRAAHLIKEAGLRSNATFIIGFPEETEKEVLDTVRLATTLPFDCCVLQFFHPFPGTEIYEEAMRKGKMTGREASSPLPLLDGIAYVPDSLDEAFLASTYERAYRKMYWRPGRVMRYIRNIRSADDIRKALYGTLQILTIGRRIAART